MIIILILNSAVAATSGKNNILSNLLDRVLYSLLWRPLFSIHSASTVLYSLALISSL